MKIICDFWWWAQRAVAWELALGWSAVMVICGYTRQLLGECVCALHPSCKACILWACSQGAVVASPLCSLVTAGVLDQEISKGAF